MLTFSNLATFAAHAGQSLGQTDYLLISQERVDLFAEATGDHQWIHTDPARAVRESPYQTTIAHGFLTLSLAPQFMASLYRIDSVTMAVNYGVNKVRFMNYVPTNSRLRMQATLKTVEPYQQGVQAVVECRFERENEAKPACIAELVTLYVER